MSNGTEVAPPSAASSDELPRLLRVVDFVTAADSPDRHRGGIPWHRDHRVAVLGIVVACLLAFLNGFAGPSIVTLQLGPRENLLPPWYLPVRESLRPNDWLASGVLWVSCLLGALSLWVAMRALARGWKPHLKRMFGLGVLINVACGMVPPQTSADVLMYAAYGRLLTIGIDPYTVSPAEVFRTQWDPVLRWTERPWQDTESVYGPVLTFSQWLANVLGGDNIHDIVFWLGLWNLLAFLALCTIVVWMCRHDERRQGRAMMLTLLNPLLIWAIVITSHNEAIGLSLALLGCCFLRRRAFVAGLLIGLACSTKATLGIYGIAMVWAYRHDLRRMLLAVIGAGIPTCIAYFVIFPKALATAATNGSYVANSSWAWPFRNLFATFLPVEQANHVISVLAWVGMVVLAWMLSRVVPWHQAPGLDEGADPRRDPLSVGLRTAMVLAAAWVLTSAYTLSWYDLMVWVPLAILGTSRLDLLMLLRTTSLNFAYIPGRVLAMSPAMQSVGQKTKEMLSASVGMALIVAVMVWWHEHVLKHGVLERRSADRRRRRGEGRRLRLPGRARVSG